MSLFISPETMAVLFELGVPLDKAMELLRCIERDQEAISKPRADNAARQRRFRERHNVTSNVTSNADSNATPPPSPALPPKPPNPPTSTRKELSTRERPTRRCPAGYSPSPETVAVANELGFTAGELERELAKIRDHEFRDARSDWDAVTRNWLRRAAPQHRATSDVRPHHDRPTQRDRRVQNMLAGAMAAVDGPEPWVGEGFGAGEPMGGPLRIVGGRDGS